MTRHLLAIDDVEEDFEMILRWAIEFKRLWKEGDDVAINFLPLDTLAVGSIYEKPSTVLEFRLKWASIVLEVTHSHY